MPAGNSGVFNEIQAINDELFEKKILLLRICLICFPKNILL